MQMEAYTNILETSWNENELSIPISTAFVWGKWKYNQFMGVCLK